MRSIRSRVRAEREGGDAGADDADLIGEAGMAECYYGRKRRYALRLV